MLGLSDKVEGLLKYFWVIPGFPIKLGITEKWNNRKILLILKL